VEMNIRISTKVYAEFDKKNKLPDVDKFCFFWGTKFGTAMETNFIKLLL